jgi:hypothetical protein
MGQRRLLSDEFGVKTWFHYDLNNAKHAEERTWALETEFSDFSHEVEASKELQKDPGHWKEGVKNDMVHYAHIPDAILMQWHSMGVNINDQRELFRMVNRPEWRYLKCTEKIHLG